MLSSSHDSVWQLHDLYLEQELFGYRHLVLTGSYSHEIRKTLFRPGEIVHLGGGLRLMGAYHLFLKQRGLTLMGYEVVLRNILTRKGASIGSPTTGGKPCVVLERAGNGSCWVSPLASYSGTVKIDEIDVNPVNKYFSVALNRTKQWPPGMAQLRTVPSTGGNNGASYVVAMPILVDAKYLKPLHHTGLRTHLRSGEVDRLKKFIKERMDVSNLYVPYVLEANVYEQDFSSIAARLRQEENDFQLAIGRRLRLGLGPHDNAVGGPNGHEIMGAERAGDPNESWEVAHPSERIDDALPEDWIKVAGRGFGARPFKENFFSFHFEPDWRFPKTVVPPSGSIPLDPARRFKDVVEKDLGPKRKSPSNFRSYTPSHGPSPPFLRVPPVHLLRWPMRFMWMDIMLSSSASTVRRAAALNPLKRNSTTPFILRDRIRGTSSAARSTSRKARA